MIVIAFVALPERSHILLGGGRGKVGDPALTSVLVFIALLLPLVRLHCPNFSLHPSARPALTLLLPAPQGEEVRNVRCATLQTEPKDASAFVLVFHCLGSFRRLLIANRKPFDNAHLGLIGRLRQPLVPNGHGSLGTARRSGAALRFRPRDYLNG
jgi:hypothetical protein